jgi:O-succinylbenzoic acid--CoA ligase
VPDTKFGEQMVLLTESHDIAALQAVCSQQLPKYWQPRRYITVGQLPLTATGKPARKEAERLAQSAITRNE